MAAEKSMRTDALRNRARLVEAARELFAEVGVESAAMNDVARRAGVGPGTLWRHFPNKDALLAEIVGQSLDGLAELAAELLASESRDFLRRWVDALVRHIAATRGMSASFMQASGGCGGPLDERGRSVERAAADLVARAVELGLVRADLAGAELIRLAAAVVWVNEAAAPPDTTERLLDLVFTGIEV
ncbi:TetR/AcrR family transcriptional regulator [Allokutzneria albata]|uniref:DNA-binding transcriptional regulator, AcrR family n=1 Tax=Allokutzneria albata TaxID=211114 RepID=A0A1G9RVP0_ALLAB|nr:TetR/AcrR family transcriptional regulator [Allokutzneria albata]SDM27077.1 DNA-binding transcriptional regulator, AcrR family [Allokutzneria albata]